MQKAYISFVLTGLTLLLLCGCDKATGPLSGSTDNGKQSVSKAVEEESYAKESLMSMLNDQETLAMQIRDAKNSADMATAKALFEEFMTREADFNAEFDAARDQLTNATVIEISRRHSEVTRALN